MDRKLISTDAEKKIATLPGVHEYGECEAPEIWIRSNGRIVVRAYNEGGNNFTDVDLLELLAWASTGDFDVGSRTK